MKRLTALLLCLCMCMPFACVCAWASCAVVETPLWDDNGQIGSMKLRFYTDKPRVAYAGIKAYMAAVGREVTVTPQEDGTWVVADPEGHTLTVDPAAGTAYTEDWNGFQKDTLSGIKDKYSIKDTDCKWTMVTGIEITGEPKPVTFDFGKYGIAVYANKDDVYLPLALLADMMEDESLNLILYNGEKLFRYSGRVDNLYTLVNGYYESQYMKDYFSGAVPRGEDLIRESYAELCFVMDYFYGHPGVAPLDEAVAEKGLDAATSDLPDGEQIREALHSADFAEFYDGLNDLICDGFYDGHTTITSMAMMQELCGEQQANYLRLMAKILEGYSRTSYVDMQSGKLLISRTRDKAWGEETYRECGSTAVIRMDDFTPDEKGWIAWNAGEGEMPMDTLGIVYTGLEKAAANPAIRNVVFDLTNNGGGSQDMMAAIVGLIADTVVMDGYNVLTGQLLTADFQTDKNMDGVIDGQDKTAKYDFHYAVLTSARAFSCGNVFPFIMQDLGAAVIGEPTGGGSCAVQAVVLSDGTPLLMSSYQWRMQDEEGRPIEYGAQPDILLEGGAATGDYSAFYDDEQLDRLVTAWFEAKKE